MGKRAAFFCSKTRVVEHVMQKLSSFFGRARPASSEGRKKTTLNAPLVSIATVSFVIDSIHFSWQYPNGS